MQLHHNTEFSVTQNSNQQNAKGERVAISKPLLRRGIKHLRWAKEYQNFMVDGSKFVICVSNGKIDIRRQTEKRMIAQCLKPTVKQDGGTLTPAQELTPL